MNSAFCIDSTPPMSPIFVSLLVVFGACLLGVTSSNQGSVRVCNRGAYVAKCYLESRNVGGGSRSYDTGKFLAGQCASLDLPYEAVWGRVTCDNYVFISSTKRVFQEEFNTPSVRCYNIAGTTFHPSMSRTNC